MLSNAFFTSFIEFFSSRISVWFCDKSVILFGEEFPSYWFHFWAQWTAFLSSLSFHHNYCCSLTQSCPTLCDSMDCSMPGFPVLHQLPKLAQTHVHWVTEAVQPSYPLSSPSPPAFNLSQHQWPKYWSFSISPANKYSGLISFRIGLISLPSKGFSRVFFRITVQKHKFFGIQPSLWPNSHIYTWLLETS